MSVFAEPFRPLIGLFALALAGATPAGAEAPARVVSINLCTDQLAMLIAEPGQLVSVTHLASDPEMSSMADQARIYPANRGRAEEVFVMVPDLVLAGVWTDGASISMLRRLGVEVVQFSAAASVEEMRTNISRMGQVLGQKDRAADVLAGFDTRLAALPGVEWRPRAAIYSANSFVFGRNMLAGQIVELAGFDNISTEFGLDWGGILPLEQLVMAAPDVVISGDGGVSRAEDVLTHPALAGFRQAGALTDEDWACATPFVLDAVARLVAVRKGLTP